MAPIQRRGRGLPQSKAAPPVNSSSQPRNAPSPSRKVDGRAVEVTGDKEGPSSGLTIYPHPIWPDIDSNQGELFFECTLFLYSVLALFLQYLNLYKSLWWLPKSFWHYSMKVHNINPYFLSCVGLLLGLRVTKCFWSTISSLFSCGCEGRSDAVKQALTLVQYGILKVPMTTMILTSFFFSFTRIVREFPPSSVVFFFFPPFVYTILFYQEIIGRVKRVFSKLAEVLRKDASLNDVVDELVAEDKGLLDLETVAHMCHSVARNVRKEVDTLIVDVYLRLKRCLFAGISTAFLSIFLPLIFMPYKTSVGLPQKVLVNELWQVQMAIVVFVTAFTHYITYLFPLHYIDLLHRSAMHLGRWDLDDSQPLPSSFSLASSVSISSSSSQSKKPPVVLHAFPPPSIKWSPDAMPYPEGTLVETKAMRRFRGFASSPKIRSISAEPENLYHSMFAFWCASPLSIVNYLCLSQLLLIFFQFWLLVLTLEWQHILTIVFLMFANYLLLGKLFKDRVILQRVYDPSKEDLQLIQQVQLEVLKRRDSNADVK